MMGKRRQNLASFFVFSHIINTPFSIVLFSYVVVAALVVPRALLRGPDDAAVLELAAVRLAGEPVEGQGLPRLCIFLF